MSKVKFLSLSETCHCSSSNLQQGHHIISRNGGTGCAQSWTISLIKELVGWVLGPHNNIILRNPSQRQIILFLINKAKVHISQYESTLKYQHVEGHETLRLWARGRILITISWLAGLSPQSPPRRSSPPTTTPRRTWPAPASGGLSRPSPPITRATLGRHPTPRSYTRSQRTWLLHHSTTTLNRSDNGALIRQQIRLQNIPELICLLCYVLCTDDVSHFLTRSKNPTIKEVKSLPREQCDLAFSEVVKVEENYLV